MLQACKFWCQRTPDCRGWTRNKKSGQCFLITLSKQKEKNSDWVSGIRCEDDEEMKIDRNGILYFLITFNLQCYNLHRLYFQVVPSASRIFSILTNVTSS